MLTNVGPATERNWSEKDYPGIRNMQIKLWKLVSQVWFVFHSLVFLFVEISSMLIKIYFTHLLPFNLIFVNGFWRYQNILQFLLFPSDDLKLGGFTFRLLKKNCKSEILRFYEERRSYFNYFFVFDKCLKANVVNHLRHN